MGKPLRVLIVEDSEDDTLLLVRELKRGGYDPTFERVDTPEAMGAALERQIWDIVIADYVMPHFSGLNALKSLQKSGLDIPFIIVSGSIGEDTAVAAMKAGANDYLMKNKLARLVPAIQQELRGAEVRGKLSESEKALQESEKRYRQVVENATEIIYTIDEKGNFTYGNPAGLKVTGYSLQELRELNYTDLVVPDHRERVSQVYINQFRERRPTTYVEFPFFSKAGEIIWFGQNTSLVIEDGKVVGFHIIARDITERKKAEEALKESEEKYRLVVENANEAIFVIQDGMLRFFNIKNIELIGYSKEELTSAPYINFVHPDDRQTVFERYLKRIKGEELLGVNVFRIVDKAGNIRWVEVNSVLISWEGRPATLNFLNNITERKRAEDSLRESVEALRAFLNANPEVSFLMDAKGTVLVANESLFKRFSKSSEEIIGSCLYDLFPEDVTKQRKSHFDEVFRTGKPVHFEDVRMDRNYETFVHPVFDKEGNVAEVAILGFDITERKRAEEALRESEERYRTILETIEEGYYEVDITGNFTLFNDSLCRMLGYTRDELMGMSNRQYMDKETAKKVYQVFNQLYTTGEPYKAFDWEIIRKDGTKRFHDSSVSLIRNTKGEKIGFRGIARDITERKRAEEVLRTEREKLEVVTQNMGAGLAFISKDYHTLWANNVLKQIFGDVEGKTCHSTYNRRAEVCPGCGVREVFEKGSEKVVHEQVGEDIEGNTIWSEIIATPIKDKEGNITAALELVVPITERKRAEESLKQSEENARRLAHENAVMAEIGRIISSTLNIEEVYERFAEEVRKLIPFDRIMINLADLKNKTSTPAYTAGIDVPDRRVGNITPMAGTVTEEVIRTRSSLLIKVDNDNIDEVVSRFPPLFPTFQAGLRSIISVPLISKDQVIGVLSLRSLVPKAYTDQDVRLAERIGVEIAGAIANAQLYAERIQAEKERAALEEQLRQSQKIEAIGRLAGGIAHDFNNLLTVIKGYSQLSLLELKETDPMRGSIEEIKRAADRAADLTRQLLAFSRRQILEMRVLDLNTVLRDLDKMLRRVIGEDIELVTLLAEGLGRVKTDHGQMQQVIMNLAVDAKDAMPNGGKLTIETANVELDETYARSHVAVIPGRYAMLSVSDTGVGMTAEVKEQVFEPFFTTKEKGKGTGLGLATVYGIVKQSGGNIWVYSEPGQGTTFKIYLPRVDEPLEELKEKAEVKEIPRGSETILVVEDEEKVLKLTVQILRGQGYAVLEAPHGDDALLVCEQHEGPIHLMVTDVVMPNMSGHELAKRLKAFHPEMKVLYMSGYTDNAIVHHGVLEKGMNYIQKPFTVDGLARKVREVLDK